MSIIFKIFPLIHSLPVGATYGRQISEFIKLHNGIVIIQLSTPFSLELEGEPIYTQIAYYPETQKWWLEYISITNNQAIEIELIHVDHHDIMIAD